MASRARELAIIFGLGLLVVLVLAAAHFTPWYFSNEFYLGALVFFQLLVAAIWKFRQLFFPFLIVSFIWAGADLPMTEAWTSARWIVLAAGAAVGYLLFMHDRGRRFHAIHLVALFCVLAAFISALVSTYPQFALLKAASLFLLFLYGGAGGRMAVQGRESSFFPGLLAACEVVTFLTAVCYFVLHVEVWGNPNSLGLVMGVVIAPVLFWALLLQESRAVRWRRTASFFLAICLLLYSLSRASIIAGTASMFLICVVLRRRKLLLQAVMLVAFVLAAAAILAPSRLQNVTQQSTSDVFYKGHRDTGILGSRKSPWNQTISVISEHPWFGSGFGTSPSGKQDNGPGRYSSNTDTNREHGSSYLAILEWVGLLGILPFASLLFLLLRKVAQALVWLYHNPCPNHPVVPLLLVMVGGMIHASFEDWLFAVGYYLTVFFWTLAFVIFDLTPVSPAPLPVATEQGYMQGLHNPMKLASGYGR